MNILAKIVEICVVFGGNCASVGLLYQPKMPESLK